MADPDLELKGGGEGGFVLLALPAFLPSVISSFSTQNNGGTRASRAPPSSPSPRSATGIWNRVMSGLHKMKKLRGARMAQW